MVTKKLKWLTIILPVLFGILLSLVRLLLFRVSFNWRVELVIVGLIFLGAAIFSSWVFQLIEQREQEIRQRTEQLASLNEAALLLTQELDLSTVLQKVVVLAAKLVNARFGALGVLDEKGERIDQFITYGLSPEERARIAHPPEGRGLIGAIIRERRPICIPEISEDHRSVGFPANHPPMHSFLGVPIKYKGRVLGNLYLTDKKWPSTSTRGGYTTFSRVDQQIVEMFATQAAIAIENAQLYRKTQQLAILQERERFGMDLHDGIIQSIYGIGLVLEDTQMLIESEPQVVRERLQRTLHSLNEVIRDIRNYILDLRPERFKGRNLLSGLEELARDFRANTLLEVDLSSDSVDASRLTPEQTVEILHIAQEALTNVRKHARASRVSVDLMMLDEDLVLTIKDDGVGIKPSLMTVGYGLRNMRERANSLKGDIVVEPGEKIGTQVVLRVPLDSVKS